VTTIHGNPDLYISKDQEKPGPEDFLARSTQNGIFPDIVYFD
jgi:hypothetical protein